MADGPKNYEARGTYTGPLALLKGEAAKLVVYENGRCMAMFDRIETGYAFGYHDFATEHFDLIADGTK